MMDVAIPGGVLQCLTAGARSDRPSLVLLHGIQGTARVWQPLLADLSRDRLVVAPHMRGRAGSYSPDDSGAYGLDHFATDLRAVMAAVSGPVVLVGWSMGCLVALEYLRHHGTLGLAGLGLVSGSACLWGIEGHEAVWFHGDSTEAIARNAADRALRLRLTESASDIAVAGSWQAAQAADFRLLLPRLDLPVLVLHGQDDAECPVIHGREMAGEISGASLGIWPGCGHVPMADDPQRFVHEIGMFLRKCDKF